LVAGAVHLIRLLTNHGKEELMTEQENVQVVRRLYGSFKQGDMQALRDTLADEVEWYEPGPVDVLPWAGVFRGRERVVQLLTRFSEVAEVEQFELSEIIAQGDTVVVIEDQRAYFKATGRPLREDAVRVFKLRGGKIITARVWEDTALQVAAVCGT
jgi:ketosteroid isomerase-like protein